MSDPANPLQTYHQRQIDDQATPVRLYGENGGPATVQLSGSSTVTIGEETFASEGSTIRGLAANRPTAAAAHAAMPYATYWAVDTGAITVTDGTNWQDV